MTRHGFSSRKGDTLLAKFVGDPKSCPDKTTNIKVDITLQCDREAQWPTPITGQPGQMPVASVQLDSNACKVSYDALTGDLLSAFDFSLIEGQLKLEGLHLRI